MSEKENINPAPEEPAIASESHEKPVEEKEEVKQSPLEGAKAIYVAPEVPKSKVSLTKLPPVEGGKALPIPDPFSGHPVPRSGRKTYPVFRPY
jgi:hypothetical protein